MSLSDLASLGSFVSGIAVLISLIYLAVQVRQASKHTAAQISQSRVQMGLGQQDMFITDPAVADIMMRGMRGEILTESEGFRFYFIMSNTFLGIEDEFRQYKAALISEARHNGFVKRMAAGMQMPGYRAMWMLQREGFEPDFRAFMDAAMQQGREKGLPAQPINAWQTALAAELDGQSP